MKTRTKTVLAALAGIGAGGTVGALVGGYGFMVVAQPEGLEALGALVFGFFGAIVGAPLGCYVALRTANVEAAGLTTAKAIGITVAVVAGWSSVVAVLGTVASGSVFSMLALAAAVGPVVAFISIRRKNEREASTLRSHG